MMSGRRELLNPLLTPSPLPYGFPDFAAIREEHFAEAFDVAMAEQRAEIAVITAQPGTPTFDDTVVALERSGATLRRVSAVFFVLVGSLSTPGIRETEARIAPLLAAHHDAITLDPALFTRLDDVTQLDGLAPDAVAAAARAAENRGQPGRWVLPLVLPSHQPALASLTDRALRERLYRASVSRCARGDANDTRDVVRRITTLRAERAGLLGHPHHASWVIEIGTAETVEAVEKMLLALVPAAVRNAEAEAAELAEAAGRPIEPWDRAFHTERVRRA